MVALRIAGALSLAAAPSFATIAILTVPAGGAVPICSVAPGSFPLDGMTVMYLLMNAFHLSAWLRPVAGNVDELA